MPTGDVDRYGARCGRGIPRYPPPVRRRAAPAGFHEGSTKPLPDWTKVHEELKRRGVTLMILWEEHRAAYVDGHGYSRYVAPGFMLRVRRRARDAALSAGPRGT